MELKHSLCISWSHFDVNGFPAPFRTVADSILAVAASVFRGFPTIRSQHVCYSAMSGVEFVNSLSSAGNAVPPVPHRPRRSQREHMAATSHTAESNVLRQHAWVEAPRYFVCSY